MQKKIMPNVYHADQLVTASGLNGATHYENMLTLLSRKERFTYMPMYPHRSGKISFPDYDGELIVASDFCDFGPNRMLLADDCNLLISGHAEITEYDESVYVVLEKTGKMLFAVKGFEKPEFLDADYEELRKQRASFIDDLDVFPEVDDDDTARAVARAWSLLRGCIYAPEGKMTGYYITPDRWPHRACWIMDSVYQALSVQRFNRKAAVDAVFALFAHQTESGKVPQTVTPFNISTRMTTQQPIIASGLKALNPTKEEIAAALPHLIAFIDWLYMRRDIDDDGMFEWFTWAANKDCPCGESGMDNSPRFDSAGSYAAIDLNCFISRECEVIAEFAGIVGNTAEQERFAERHRVLNEKIEANMWCDEIDFYTDVEIVYWKQTKVMAVSGFLPLMCGAASPERAAKLAAHVRNPKTFGTYYPLPSVSVSDPGFEKDMWRGPVWHIFNYLASEGLDRYGYHEEADIIRRKTVEAGVRYYKEYGAFYEFYDCDGEIPPGLLNRKGPNTQDLYGYHRSIHDYGWSASIFLYMLAKTINK